MSELNEDISELRKEYREIFLKSVDEINSLLVEIKPESVEGDIFESYPDNSAGREWQKAAIKFLQEDIAKNIYRKLNEILAYRSQFKCTGCATCCNLACSQFSHKELMEKANNGDNFAKQFLSVFIPYSSKEEARMVYPEYIKLLEENNESDVYFYHCPKLTTDKRCSDYENRPQICRDFPDNPLSILPKSCGYRAWKDEIEPIALMLHSMIEIVEFYTKKLSGLLKDIDV